jgi:hypothetical protein
MCNEVKAIRNGPPFHCNFSMPKNLVTISPALMIIYPGVEMQTLSNFSSTYPHAGSISLGFLSFHEVYRKFPGSLVLYLFSITRTAKHRLI